MVKSIPNEYNYDNLESTQKTIRYTVRSKGYQVRAICFFKCKRGIAGTVDGFGYISQILDYDKMLVDAINQAFFKVECSVEEFYPIYASIIEFRPSLSEIDEYLAEDKTFQQYKFDKGSSAKVNKTQYDTLKKILSYSKEEKNMTKRQEASAYIMIQRYGKSLKRIAEDTGRKNEYNQAVNHAEYIKNKALEEKANKSKSKNKNKNNRKNT